MQTISTADLERTDSLSVWVVNNANPAGSINLSINDGTGNMIPIVIPITWVPVDLTTQATKSAIITNPQFRRLVASNMLLLLSEEEALKKLNTKDAQEENARIYKTSAMQSTVNMPTNVQDQLRAEKAQVSGFVMNIVERKDIDENSCMSALKSQAHTLKKDDLEYLINNSTYSEVKNWASSRLEEL